MSDSLRGDCARPLLGSVNSDQVLRKPAGSHGQSFRLKRGALLTFALLLALVSPAPGAPIISCHCFQDRSFDPAEPRRVEPYLLATTRNSFLAVAFGQSKKEIVRLRMAGTAGEDLWVAYYLAAKIKVPAGELLQSRNKTDSWLNVLAARGIDPGQIGPFFGNVLAAGGNDQALADAAADETLGIVAGVAPGDLIKFRERGADTGEIILALLIAQRIGRPALDLHAEVQAGRATWGGLLDSVGIQPAEMEWALRTLQRQGG
ncbi:MAG TPA: hypothetical protein VD811_07390 [Desulfuromonadales bacterium]|nr:hypothetical protein [Desulfuromonadales bacterium]